MVTADDLQLRWENVHKTKNICVWLADAHTVFQEMSAASVRLK